jgi:molybdopterin synthase sulfur carrier subunit
MSLQIRYFASLRDRMGRASDSIDNVNVASVAEVWARVSGNQPFPANTLVAVNMEIADLSREVKEGDEIAFFPPVTGG